MPTDVTAIFYCTNPAEQGGIVPIGRKPGDTDRDPAPGIARVLDWRRHAVYLGDHNKTIKEP